MIPITVTPKQGYKIYDPARQDYLEAEGRVVAADEFYWDRLARDGDVTISAVAEVKAAAAPNKSGKPNYSE
jgi:hypothetical protein